MRADVRVVGDADLHQLLDAVVVDVHHVDGALAFARQDVVDTLELIWRMARPFTLNIFSLKVIPNTVLEDQMREAGLDVAEPPRKLEPEYSSKTG